MVVAVVVSCGVRSAAAVAEEGTIYVFNENMPSGGWDMVELCSNTCKYSNDTFCDDSGPNADDNACPLGTDCADCGPSYYAAFPTLADAVESFTDADGIFDGSLYVENTTLTSLEAMESVVGITGKLIVRDNPDLTSIASLSDLDFVGNTTLFVSNALSSLDGLESLTRVGGNIDFYDEQFLSTIHVPSLETVGGTVYVSSNANVTSIEFPVLVSTGELIVEDMPVSRVSFPALSGVGVDPLYDASALFLVGFEGNPEIDFSMLEIVNGPMFIIANDGLRSLDGFNKLVYVNSFIRIERNDALESIGGFASLEGIDDSLTITENPMLSSITGFGALATVGDDVIITENPNLVSIAGAQSLQTVDGCCELNATSLAADLAACDDTNVCTDD